MKTESARYRRSPCVIAAWVANQLIFENYATQVRAKAAPIACELLDACGDWQSIAELANRLPQYQQKSLQTAARQLVQATLLQSSQRSSNSIEETIHQWKHWHPSAAYFHFATRDGAYESDETAIAEHFHKLADRMPMPSPVKHYPKSRGVAMHPPAGDGDFRHLLLARRTWREFSRESVSYQDLSTLFWLTFRIQAWCDFYGVGRLALKTSPSGGARHPIEVYVAARNVKGLSRGLYHYAADAHALEYLRDLPSQRFLRSLTPTQDWCSEAAAMVFMTAVFARDHWKYPMPRAYRAVLIDAGHLCQTFCLTATWLGLAPYSTMALSDSKIEKLLELDGVSEGAIYLAGVGARPADFSPEDFTVPNSEVPAAGPGSRPKRSTKAAKRGSVRKLS